MHQPDAIGEYPQLGDVIADKYRIERVLGGGGMGTVFSATHLMTGRRFALKWMNSDTLRDQGARERFIREFQAAGSIVHANVAAVLDVGAQDGALFIVMEYLDGESLAARIARGPLPPSECLPIVLQAMRGVAAAHRHDIVHRDLKPDNIFICVSPGRSRSETKVLDFGVMKAVNARAQVLPTITARGVAVGTAPYMAPEQVLALPSIDHRVDVYAFGVILYEALSGRLPFSASSSMRLLERIVHGGAPALSDVAPELPPGLTEVVMRALEREPLRRYSTLEDFAQELLPFVHSDAVASAPQVHAEPVSGLQPVVSETAITREVPVTPEPAQRIAAGGSQWAADTQRLHSPLPPRAARRIWPWFALAGCVLSVALWQLQSAPRAKLQPQPSQPPPIAAPPRPLAAQPEPPPSAAGASAPESAASTPELVPSPLPELPPPPELSPRAAAAARPRKPLVVANPPPPTAASEPPAAKLPRKTSGVSLSDF